MTNYARALFLSNTAEERAEALDAGRSFSPAFRETGKTMATEVIARISARHPYIFPGCRHWRNPHAFIWRFRAGFPALHQWKGI